MAAGEYVSVSSQADSERADIARERRELQDDPASALEEWGLVINGTANSVKDVPPPSGTTNE
jgi:VIT1/CCC1 family predicted Fe2+/Mn2+ transporter